MKANQATHPVRVMCRLLKVSASGFYAWEGRPMSARARADIGLTARIHEIHRRSAASTARRTSMPSSLTITASASAASAWRD